MWKDTSLAGKIILNEIVCVLCFMRVVRGVLYVFLLAENGSHFGREVGFEVSILDDTCRVLEQMCVCVFLASSYYYRRL